MLVGFIFVSNSMFDFGILAQSSIQTAADSGLIPCVTNLSELSKLTEESSCIIVRLRLDMVVCSMSRAEIGLLAVMDSVAPVRLCDFIAVRRLGSATTKRSGDSHEIEPVILVGY